MAAKFFTGLEMSDPDPECVFGHGERRSRPRRWRWDRRRHRTTHAKVPVAISSR